MPGNRRVQGHEVLERLRRQVESGAPVEVLRRLEKADYYHDLVFFAGSQSVRHSGVSECSVSIVRCSRRKKASGNAS